MKTFLVAMLLLVTGALVGGFLAVGVGTGIGAATGYAAGACSALEAAHDQGLVSDEQFGQVLAAAAAKIAGQLDLPPDAGQVDSAAKCREVLAQLEQARVSK